jgi:hypothetical protein
MKDFANTVSETVKQMGQAFLIAYYFPSMVLVLLHLYVLFPIWEGQPDLAQFWMNTEKLVLPTIGEIEAVSLIAILLLPVVVGMILMSLNDVLICVFEGKPWWLQWGILYPLLRFKQKRWEKLYGDLAVLKDEYRRVNNLKTSSQGEEAQQLQQQLSGLTLQIDEAHRFIEKRHPRQILPWDKRRVSPTQFGNAYAIAEEYAHERYGVDSVLFWPHLRSLMYEAAPEHANRITQQKVSLDLALNFACVFGVLAFEAILTLYFGIQGHERLLFSVFSASLLLFIAFYNSCINAVSTLGELIKFSFDNYRFLVLKSFGLEPPKELSEEQAVWIQLAAFVRRGDTFYYPVEAKIKKEQSAEKNAFKSLIAGLKYFFKGLSWLGEKVPDSVTCTTEPNENK